MGELRVPAGWARVMAMALTLLSRDLRAHDRRDHTVHMIFVARQHTVLARHAGGVAGLAEILFHLTEIGHEILRIALLVALQIGAAFLEGYGRSEQPAVLQDAQMRLMDEIREASFLLSTEGGEKLTTRPLPWMIRRRCGISCMTPGRPCS